MRWAIPIEMHYFYKQCSGSTIKETLMGQSSLSKSGEGKIKENLVAHEVVDKCKIGGKK